MNASVTLCYVMFAVRQQSYKRDEIRRPKPNLGRREIDYAYAAETTKGNRVAVHNNVGH